MTAGGGSDEEVRPAGERRPRVFLSYTADGDASAHELKEMLGAHDIVISDLPESLPGASNGRWSRLVDEVRTSDFFVALVSPDYATHTATLAEAALAAKARVSGSLGSIIPVQMSRETEIPALLLPYRPMDVSGETYRQLLDVLLGRERWTDLDGSAFDEVVGQIDSIVAERHARTSWVRAQSAIRSSVWASGASFLAFAGIFVTSVSLSASVGLQLVLGAVALLAFGSNSFSAYKLGTFIVLDAASYPASVVTGASAALFVDVASLGVTAYRALIPSRKPSEGLVPVTADPRLSRAATESSAPEPAESQTTV